MTKEELFRRYEAIKKNLEFFIELDNPLLQILDEDNYKGMSVMGEWLVKPNKLDSNIFFVINTYVTLEIIHKEHLPGDWILRNSYELRNIEKMAKLPRILKRGIYEDVAFVVYENIAGGRIIDRHPFSISTPDQKKEVAQMYWATVEVLKTLDRSKLASQSSVAYFENKFTDWVDLRIKLEPQWKPSAEEVLDLLTKIFGKVCRLANGKENGQDRKIKMEWFFNVFGNTDIVKSQAGEYIIYNARLVPKPQGFGIAAWMWNIMMYSWNEKPQKLLQEIFLWINIFLEGKDRKEHLPGILANLIERCVGALYVDLPGKRSPYDDLNEEAIEKSRKNFSYVLDTLSDVVI